MPVTLAISMTAHDGMTWYLRDGPDEANPRRTVDPFDARPFPDRAAVVAYLAAHPEVDRPGVTVVPWPIDLDVAVRIEEPDDREPPPVPARPTRKVEGRNRDPEELFRWS